MMTLIIGFLIGCAFGAILFLGGASSYRKILGTLLLKDMTIIKLMMTAIGVGTLGIYLLDQGGLAHMSIKPAYIWGIVAGGAIFGTGWAISGYCPGTCLVGTAEGKFDAVATLIGGLVGALIFAWAFPMLDELLLQNANFGKITIQGLL
ncbi:MAG: YeeE/YedE family protein, partial [Porticoccaceae bacterium]|nr:YeeE/YedE family protein [Porticoccaceae bacterium]